MAGPLGGFLSGQDAGVSANLARQKRSDEQYAGAYDRLIKGENANRANTAENRQGIADVSTMRETLFKAAADVTPANYGVFRDRVRMASEAYPNLGLTPEYFDNAFGIRAQQPTPPPAILGGSTQNVEQDPEMIVPPTPPPEPYLPAPSANPQAAGAAAPPESGFRFQSPKAEADYLRQQTDLESAKMEAQHGNEFNNFANDYLLDAMTDPISFGRKSAEFRAHAREQGFSDKFVDDQLQEITANAVRAQDEAASQVGKSKERTEQKRMAVKDLEGFLGRALAKSDGFGNFSLGDGERSLYLFLLQQGTSAVESGQTAAEAFRYLAGAYGDQPGFKVKELNAYAQGILGAPEWYVEKLRQMPPGSTPYWAPELGRGIVELPDGRKYELDPPNRMDGGLPAPPAQNGPMAPPAAAAPTVRASPFGAPSGGLPPPQRSMFSRGGGA